MSCISFTAAIAFLILLSSTGVTSQTGGMVVNAINRCNRQLLTSFSARADRPLYFIREANFDTPKHACFLECVSKAMGTKKGPLYDVFKTRVLIGLYVLAFPGFGMTGNIAAECASLANQSAQPQLASPTCEVSMINGKCLQRYIH